jgi:hypothetical protein
MDFKTPNVAAYLNIRFECAKKTIAQNGYGFMQIKSYTNLKHYHEKPCSNIFYNRFHKGANIEGLHSV